MNFVINNLIIIKKFIYILDVFIFLNKVHIYKCINLKWPHFASQNGGEFAVLYKSNDFTCRRPLNSNSNRNNIRHRRPWVAATFSWCFLSLIPHNIRTSSWIASQKVRCLFYASIIKVSQPYTLFAMIILSNRKRHKSYICGDIWWKKIPF